ncbi:MAG: thiamine phosphate synthase [Bacteroidetes bacterium]|nr:thiamine phosphate synthase [Bacteroidota bacterium]
MIVLISSEESISNEIKIVEKILIQFPEVLFHLRKPMMTELQMENWLKNIDKSHYKRISTHQHHRAAEKLGLTLLHQKEMIRNIEFSSAFSSTSFHQKKEAEKEYKTFDYFFCSPVFQSISKPNYASSEHWNIQNCPVDFKEKAVALGGLDLSTIAKAKELGFQNFAFLGAVWESANPFDQFSLIHKTCLENAQSV